MNIKNRAYSKILWIGLLAFLIGTAAPQPAQAGWFDFLFPFKKKETGPDPSQTLQAPFADLRPYEEGKNVKGAMENRTPLDQPHRNTKAVEDWVTAQVSDLLKYDAASYQDQYKNKAVIFKPLAQKQYVAFLQQNNIIKVLQTGQYNVLAFVMHDPNPLSNGAVDGVYRWLFDVDVMLSFAPVNMPTDQTGINFQTDGVVSKQVKLKVQVVRDLDAPNDDGMMIEKWEGSVVSSGDDEQ